MTLCEALPDRARIVSEEPTRPRWNDGEIPVARQRVAGRGNLRVFLFVDGFFPPPVVFPVRS
jgi:hypothetical protein